MVALATSLVTPTEKNPDNLQSCELASQSPECSKTEATSEPPCFCNQLCPRPTVDLGPD